MTQTSKSAQLTKLAAYLSQQIGLNFSDGRLPELKRGISLAARDFGFQNMDSCIEWLLSSPLTRQRIEVLASHLTVGETYFFREKKSLEVFKNDILSEIRSRHARDHYFRIWSAGCASGEEPYSIAISLMEAMPDIANWNITILATDVNPRFLQKATKGIYSKWSFRDCPAQLRQKYFREVKENTFEINRDIKKMVSFVYQNLAEDQYPPWCNDFNAMDVIFCRNVLMYFNADTIRRVVDKLYHCLVDEGRLIVSPTETSEVLSSRFSIVNYPNGTMYKKSQKPENEPKAEVMNLEFNLPSSKMMKRDTPPALENKIEPREKSSFQKAETSFKQGRYAESEKSINTVMKEHPEDAQAMILEARTQANRGKLQEAIRWCREAISQDKTNATYHYLLATILHEQGQIAEAIDSLKRVIFLDSNFALAYFMLGTLTQRTGNLKESSKYFKNALSLLKKYQPDEVLPESDGITAGRLSEVIRSYVEEQP